MDIKIDMSFPKDMCPYCYGSGKLRAMQSAITSKGISIRTNDTLVKCKYCKGSGLLKK